MQTLVFEATTTKRFAPTTAAEAIVTLSSPVLRPRLQGQAGKLAGPGAGALVADKAVVVFAVRPSSVHFAGMLFYALAGLTATRRIVRYRRDGEIDVTVFPDATADVSGQLLLGNGILAFDADLSGVCRVELDVGVALPFDGATYQPGPLLTQVQVFAKMRISDREGERVAADRPGWIMGAEKSRISERRRPSGAP